ncbi:hypothetical protein SAMN04487959_11353 [Modicisalibacter xianhensis]|uniref:Uncharacterized protein n=1 Tax=Modicisalibacter xianhensis TaxID=442341 RepID=A0A1I3EA89_9GAMM|nr:hypothetical protein SAMN04487959_11353 [Halomonas xianhensis]
MPILAVMFLAHTGEGDGRELGKGGRGPLCHAVTVTQEDPVFRISDVEHT